MNILFTGGGGAGSLSLFNRLSTEHNIYFSDSSLNAIHPSIPFSSVIQTPSIDDINFIPFQVDICNKNDIDIVLPGIDEELLLWSQSIAPFINGKVLLPDKNFIQRHLDKYESAKFLNENFLSVPATFLASQPHDLSGELILKPRFGRGSRNVFMIRCHESIPFILKNIDADPSEFVIQQRIYGTEYTVGVCADQNGNLRSVVPLEIITKKGITISSTSVNDSCIVDYAIALHALDPTPGYYNIQLIKNPDNQVYPFEINPRISTTTCQVLAAGVNPIDIYFEDVDPNDMQNLMSYSSGLRMDRYFQTFFGS